MSSSRLFILSAIVSSFPISSTVAQQNDKPAAVAAYEECAVRVFAVSKKLSDVFKQCEAQMDAFTAHLDDQVKEKVRQRTMAETQRELRAREKAKEKKNTKTGG